MGFRFSRRISLFPGLTLNLSGSGVSATVGVPGANFNVSQRGIYGTAGIPGSGLRYRTKMMKFPSENPSQEGLEQHPPLSPEFSPYSFERAGKSFKSQEGDLTSFNLGALKAMIFDHRNQLAEAKVNVAKLNAELAKEKRKKLLLTLLSFGFLFAQNRAEMAENISDIEENIAFESELASSGGIKFILPPGTAAEQVWDEFTEIFRYLAGSHCIWDVSSILENDLSYRRTTRSNSANSYERNKVNFEVSKSGIFETDINVPLLGNFNGSQMMLHPGFMHIQQGPDGLSLIDFQQIEIDLMRTRFVEVEEVPSDANVVSQVWAKENKDGSPDLRFNQNYQLPVCEYAEVTLSTFTGLQEKYLVSNVMAAERFVSAFKALKARFKHDLRFFSENGGATIAGTAEAGSKDDAGIEPSAATLLDIHGSTPSGDRTSEDTDSELAELRMYIATLMLAAARVSFSEEQERVLFNRGEENVLDQMAAQLPKDVKVGEGINFDIRVDYTDGDGNFIPNVKLRLSYIE
jgi:Protein of unknown function (DUF4236)